MDALIYFIDGAQQHAKIKNIQKLSLAFITAVPKYITSSRRPTQKYILVYLNDPEYSSSFSDLKTVLEIMPFPYFSNLVKILLVKPTFLEKAGRYFVFGTIGKFINSQIENIDDIEQLAERLVMDSKELAKHIPNYIRQHFRNQGISHSQAIQPIQQGTSYESPKQPPKS